MRHALGQVPFAFEANEGQFHPSVDFAVRRGSHSFLLKRTGELVSIVDAPRNPSLVNGARGDRTAYIQMQLLDARARPEVRAAARLPGTTNYLIGNDPKRWQHNVRSYRRVVYEGVYRGVDLIYHPHRSMLEYDFRLRPGADPATIAFGFGGARADIDPDGDLVLHTPAGKIRHRRPVAFQRVAGQRRLVPASYSLDRRGNVRFSLGAYDPTRPLVIDPVVDFATYLGGGGEDSARAVELDDAGNIYVAGVTTSVDFPIKGAADEDNKGDTDVFVTKLSPDGSRIIYSTYLGGTGDESGTVRGMSRVGNSSPSVRLVRESPVDVDLDASGNIYVTGATSSDDFPAVSPPPGAVRGGGADAFVSKLSADGSTLLRSTYLGGAGEDVAYGIALDDLARAYVTGRTESEDFPTTSGSYDRSCGIDGKCDPQTSFPVQGQTDIAGDAFLTRIDLEAARLDYSTYLGGTTDESAYDVAVDQSRNAYVAATQHPFTHVGSSQNSETTGIVWKVTATGDALGYATTVPARGLRAISVDSTGSVAVGGDKAGDEANNGALVAKLNEVGSLVWEKPLHLNSRNHAVDASTTDVELEDSGKVYVTGVMGLGSQASPPLLDPKDPVQGPGGRYDGFVLILDTTVPPQDSLLFSTPVGGTDFENAIRSGGTDFQPIFEIVGAIAVDDSGDIVAAGQTASVDFPWSDGVRTEFSGRSEGFAVKISFRDPTGPQVTALAPRSGPTTGGTEVVIEGTGLAGVSAVRFGNVPATSFKGVNGASITAVSPPNSRGVVPVTVVTPEGPSAGGYESRFTYGEGAWRQTGATREIRYGHTATLLTGEACQVDQPPDYCGKVLVAGGRSEPALPFNSGRFVPEALTRSVDLYDPRTGIWSSEQCSQSPVSSSCPAAIPSGHIAHAASLLPNGKVLVAGGDVKEVQAEDPTGGTIFLPMGSSSVLYDPRSGTWRTADDMTQSTFFHTATALPDGAPSECGRSCAKTLVAGGAYDVNPYGDGWEDTSHYDEEGDFTPASRFQKGRFYHDAVLLTGSREVCGDNCGRVLAVGGYDSEGRHSHDPAQYRSPELYDPLGDVWLTTTNWAVPRIHNSTTLLSDGRVLTVGGNTDEVNADGATFPRYTDVSEIYDPSTETWRAARSVRAPRYGHAAQLLPSGRVLVVGGAAAVPLDTAEVYEPESGKWGSAGAMVAARGVAPVLMAPLGPTATLLSSNAHEFEADPDVCGDNCGKVLVVGGSHEPFAELYTPEPTVDALSPVSSATSGTTVTLTGTGFTHGLREVRFGDSSVACPSPACTIDSYSQVTVTAPAHEPGVVEVSVVNEGGESEAGDATKFTYLASPGVVKDLKAEPLSGKEMKLTFSAPAALGSTQTPQQPAQRYVIKQSRSPITDEAGFAAASALCGGTCTFEPPIAKVGDQVSLTVKELSPTTTYHYALKVIDDSNTVGPLSNPASATTKATTPGTVSDLEAVALSRSSIELSFSAVGSDGNQPPPVGDYVIKQSSSSITDERAFDAARPLCEHACHFEPAAVGDGLTLAVTDLAPATTYHYALRAKAPQGDLGGLSNPASATTRRGPRPDDDGKEETKVLQRKVTLRLKGHLVASGWVRSDGAAACRNNVRVVIQRNSRKIRTVSTSKTGRFKVRLTDRGGVYRAVVAKTRSGSNLCAHAASPRRRHRH